MTDPQKDKPRFYGRRKGKPMRGGKMAAYNALMPMVEITLDDIAGDAPVDPRGFFEFPVEDVWLEIGFGDGKQLVHQALANPGVGFIGCEPFVNGVAAICRDMQEKDITNIRIFQNDARLFMPRLQAHSIGRCFLLNSDPWPKKRHHKRRFIQRETLDALHRLLATGAEFRMSSDHPDLADWQLHKTYFHPGFIWTAKSAADWRTRPADMPETRYQSKGQEQGRPTTFLNFVTVAGSE
ncbi:MAG: tRNA (guanosine(46)-N7)-methyltransferase TrmB [Alphaproteobacteria bacterium]|nr:tRNA (guanosine(46)-N7)-methyltransferase TrmB [Alphaproteobacteria bacterium]